MDDLKWELDKVNHVNYQGSREANSQKSETTKNIQIIYVEIKV